MGSSFTAELGAKRISDEVDALAVMSIPPVAYLVSTRILAALMANGWTEADIRKLAGENVLRVMRSVEAVAASKREERPSLAALPGDGAPE